MKVSHSSLLFMRLPGVCSRANTVVVGLPTLLRDVLPVAGKLPRAERIKLLIFKRCNPIASFVNSGCLV
jgi:hypothetical protein